MATVSLLASPDDLAVLEPQPASVRVKAAMAAMNIVNVDRLMRPVQSV